MSHYIIKKKQHFQPQCDLQDNIVNIESSHGSEQQAENMLTD